MNKEQVEAIRERRRRLNDPKSRPQREKMKNEKAQAPSRAKQKLVITFSILKKFGEKSAKASYFAETKNHFKVVIGGYPLFLGGN